MNELGFRHLVNEENSVRKSRHENVGGRVEVRCCNIGLNKFGSSSLFVFPVNFCIVLGHGVAEVVPRETLVEEFGRL